MEENQQVPQVENAQPVTPQVPSPNPPIGMDGSQFSTAPLANPNPPKPKKSKLLMALVLLVLLVAGGFGAFKLLHKDKAETPVATSTAKVVHIGLSMATLKELRWQKDEDLMTARAKTLGATVTVLVANDDDKTQVSQIENLIAQKVDVLIVVPHDASLVAPAIKEAHAAGIKVIAYDRLINDSPVDAYISFDSTKVGVDMASAVMDAVPKTTTVPNIMLVGGSPTDNNAVLVHNGVTSVTDPLVKAGTAKIVYDQYTANWDPDIAYANVKAFLATGAKVDAVIAANDGTASGVIKALAEKGLAGKVPVSGQDAELPAVQRLVSGTQTVTIYKPIKLEAEQAAVSAVALARGNTLQTTGKVNNGFMDVLAYLINPTAVTKDNIKTTIIKDGFLSSTDIYGSAAQ